MSYTLWTADDLWGLTRQFTDFLFLHSEYSLCLTGTLINYHMKQSHSCCDIKYGRLFLKSTHLIMCHNWMNSESVWRKFDNDLSPLVVYKPKQYPISQIRKKKKWTIKAEKKKPATTTLLIKYILAVSGIFKANFGRLQAWICCISILIIMQHNVRRLLHWGIYY